MVNPMGEASVSKEDMLEAIEKAAEAEHLVRGKSASSAVAHILDFINNNACTLEHLLCTRQRASFAAVSLDEAAWLIKELVPGACRTTPLCIHGYRPALLVVNRKSTTRPCSHTIV